MNATNPSNMIKTKPANKKLFNRDNFARMAKDDSDFLIPGGMWTSGLLALCCEDARTEYAAVTEHTLRS